MSVQRSCLVQYADPSGVWQFVRELLEGASPLRNVAVPSAMSGSGTSVTELPMRFQARSGADGDAECICCVYLLVCETVEAYRAEALGAVGAWIDLMNKHGLEWLVVHASVSNHRSDDFAQVHARLNGDFGATKRIVSLTVFDQSAVDSSVVEPAVEALKSAAAASFRRRLEALSATLEGAARGALARDAGAAPAGGAGGDDAVFSKVFRAKAALASLFARFGLTAEALLHYGELDRMTGEHFPPERQKLSPGLLEDLREGRLPPDFLGDAWCPPAHSNSSAGGKPIGWLHAKQHLLARTLALAPLVDAPHELLHKGVDALKGLCARLCAAGEADFARAWATAAALHVLSRFEPLLGGPLRASGRAARVAGELARLCAFAAPLWLQAGGAAGLDAARDCAALRSAGFSPHADAWPPGAPPAPRWKDARDALRGAGGAPGGARAEGGAPAAAKGAPPAGEGGGGARRGAFGDALPVLATWVEAAEAASAPGGFLRVYLSLLSAKCRFFRAAERPSAERSARLERLEASLLLDPSAAPLGAEADALAAHFSGLSWHALAALCERRRLLLAAARPDADADADRRLDAALNLLRPELREHLPSAFAAALPAELLAAAAAAPAGPPRDAPALLSLEAAGEASPRAGRVAIPLRVRCLAPFAPGEAAAFEASVALGAAADAPRAAFAGAAAFAGGEAAVEVEGEAPAAAEALRVVALRVDCGGLRLRKDLSKEPLPFALRADAAQRPLLRLVAPPAAPAGAAFQAAAAIRAPPAGLRGAELRLALPPGLSGPPAAALHSAGGGAAFALGGAKGPGPGELSFALPELRGDSVSFVAVAVERSPEAEEEAVPVAVGAGAEALAALAGPGAAGGRPAALRAALVGGAGGEVAAAASVADAHPLIASLACVRQAHGAAQGPCLLVQAHVVPRVSCGVALRGLVLEAPGGWAAEALSEGGEPAEGARVAPGESRLPRAARRRRRRRRGAAGGARAPLRLRDARARGGRPPARPRPRGRGPRGARGAAARVDGRAPAGGAPEPRGRRRGGLPLRGARGVARRGRRRVRRRRRGLRAEGARGGGRRRRRGAALQGRRPRLLARARQARRRARRRRRGVGGALRVRALPARPAAAAEAARVARRGGRRGAVRRLRGAARRGRVGGRAGRGGLPALAAGGRVRAGGGGGGGARGLACVATHGRAVRRRRGRPGVSAHLRICAFAHLRICASAHLRICAFAHLHIRTFAHSHIRTFAHPLIRTGALDL